MLSLSFRRLILCLTLALLGAPAGALPIDLASFGLRAGAAVIETDDASLLYSGPLGFMDLAGPGTPPLFQAIGDPTTGMLSLYLGGPAPFTIAAVASDFEGSVVGVLFADSTRQALLTLRLPAGVLLGSTEEHELTRLSVTVQPLAPVPLPPSLALLGSAIALAAAVRRLLRSAPEHGGDSGSRAC